MENLFFIHPRHLPHGLPLADNGLVPCTPTLLNKFAPGPFFLCERGQLWQAAGENIPHERLLLPYNSVEWAYHNGRCFELEFAQGRLKNICEVHPETKIQDKTNHPALWRGIGVSRPNFVGYRILDNTVMFAIIAKISQVYAGYNTLVIELFTVGDHKIEVEAPLRIFVLSPEGRFWQEHQKQWQRIEVAIPELAGFEYVNHIAARGDRHLITCQLIPTRP